MPIGLDTPVLPQNYQDNWDEKEVLHFPPASLKLSLTKFKSTAPSHWRGWRRTLIRNSVTVPEFLSALTLLFVI